MVAKRIVGPGARRAGAPGGEVTSAGPAGGQALGSSQPGGARPGYGVSPAGAGPDGANGEHHGFGLDNFGGGRQEGRAPSGAMASPLAGHGLHGGLAGPHSGHGAGGHGSGGYKLEEEALRASGALPAGLGGDAGQLAGLGSPFPDGALRGAGADAPRYDAQVRLPRGRRTRTRTHGPAGGAPSAGRVEARRKAEG
jgi:hypothetical protein